MIDSNIFNAQDHFLALFTLADPASVVLVVARLLFKSHYAGRDVSTVLLWRVTLWQCSDPSLFWALVVRVCGLGLAKIVLLTLFFILVSGGQTSVD